MLLVVGVKVGLSVAGVPRHHIQTKHVDGGQRTRTILCQSQGTHEGQYTAHNLLAWDFDESPKRGVGRLGKIPAKTLR